MPPGFWLGFTFGSLIGAGLLFLALTIIDAYQKRSDHHNNNNHPDR